MTTQFDQIYHGSSSELGKFRVATSGMAWKGNESEGVSAIPAPDIKWAQWMRVARDFQLRIGLRDHRRENFQGFLREDHDKLTTLLKNHFGVTLETREVSFKGWNWGETDFQGQDLVFMVTDKIGFELPLRQVTNSNIAGRTEVSLEFSNPSVKPTSRAQGDEMVEIRFFVPGTHKAKGSDAGSDKSDNEDEEEISAAQVFHDMIKDRAEIGQVSGDMIIKFEEVLVLTPRGRYDMDMFPEFLRLHGKTYDYKIAYNSISRLFLLPKDDMHVLFILGLSTPIRQGQTRYQYLVMQFTREEETTAELKMSEEEVAKYDRLKKNYEDPTFEVVSSVFRALAKKKIIGSGTFQSRTGHPGIKANLKAIQGDLFILEKYIFFVSKQPTLVELSDIHQLTFSRVGASASSRTFDVQIATKSGPQHTFTSINKEEHDNLEAYLKDKKIKIKNEMIPDADLLTAVAGDDDDDDDEMQSIDSDDDEPRKKPRPVTGGDDDEDSEDDEDFKASSEDDGGSTSESESSGGAATATDASGDVDIAQDMKKIKAAKGKGKAKAKGSDGSDDGGKPTAPKKKKAKGSDDDADDDNDESAPKKAASRPKPKPKTKEKKADDGSEMEVDEKAKPKLKPKPKAKSKPADDDEAMDIDDEKPKPKPKPKPKKPAAEVEEPPKKKIRV